MTESTTANASPATPTRESYFSLCSDLAAATNILSELERGLHDCAFAGDMRQAKLLYLAFNTRFFDRLVSVAVKGPSSGGKSFLLNTIVKFVPSEAYEQLSGMSEKAIVYWEGDLRHKHIVLQEWAGLQNSDGNKFLRQLLSDGRIRYAVTMGDGDGRNTELIEREGPTGLLLTTTETRLHREDETRLLSITVDDTPTHTAGVIREMALQAEGTARPEPSFEQWHALHRWLAMGPRKVVIPFATQLAGLIDATANRVKRDFGQVLSLIQAHALLHQHSRARTNAGAIEASLADYGAVYALISDIVADSSHASVAPRVRETVEAVQTLLAQRDERVSDMRPVRGRDVAEILGIDQGSASRRIADACEQGYLVNLENNSNRPQSLEVGDRLPGDNDVLPSPEQVRQACEMAEFEMA